jgi:flagellar biosynthesis/type III secretory pathway M-ring protein FliF/YscJ
MKRKTIIVVIAILITCVISVLLIQRNYNKEKEYILLVNYREYDNIKMENYFKEEEYKIKAKNDTIAYEKAYEQFYIAKKTYIEASHFDKSRAKIIRMPVGFKLYNDKNIDITDIQFTTRQRIEDLYDGMLKH